MNVCEPFIRRPVATTLLAVAVFLVGAVAYRFLPVASLPSVEFPSIHVQAIRPGADPATMAATVAAPLERRLGEIASVTELTSVSSLGATSISVQFDLNRNIDGAARDVQAAINAAQADLPGDLPNRPTFRKSNPAAAPVLILALTSDTLPQGALYDAADSVVAQRISQVEGVAEVTVSGAEQPAIRVRVNPLALANMGLGINDVQNAIVNANVTSPLGGFDGPQKALSIATNDQLRKVEDYRLVGVRTADGTLVRLADVASVIQGVRNTLMAGWFNRQPAVLIIVFKQADANVIATVDNIRAELPELERWIPAGIKVSIVSDRTGTIRTSIHDLELTLCVAVVLVMMVVLVFLRRLTPTVAAGVTVPLSLAGTLAAMWAAGFSIDNLSLMALTISVGFVVDDAIVMIEAAVRNVEGGMRPLEAAIVGSRQISFTIISMSVSLVAAFIPILFMGGVIGRLFKEFAATLAYAIAISAVVALTVTPMICAHFMRDRPATPGGKLDRAAAWAQGRLIAAYAVSLAWALEHRRVMLGLTLAIVAATVALYVTAPKGFFPEDDTGLIIASTQASADTSFTMMESLQRKAADVVLADPAIAGLGSFVGASGGSTLNQGRMFINLKPVAERNATVFEVIARLRAKLGRIPGIQVFLTAAQDLRVGARSAKADYQFTLWDVDIDELTHWVPIVLERAQSLPQLVDVSTDREQGGLQASVVVDRTAAGRLGVSLESIDTALNDAFAQRQISTIYAERNQYRVILEVDPRFQRDPTALQRIYVAGANGQQVPLASVAHFEKSLAPLVVNHQGQFPAVTLTYSLPNGVSLGQATAALEAARAGLHPPGSLHAELAGTAKAFAASLRDEPLLIAAALVTIYIVLGVLYESLLHPLTILSTLPSAGMGALLALRLTGTDLTLIAVIGIILLTGIVKKNGILLVDFALDAERRRGLTPREAIFEAAIERFRPILMTTMAALFGAVPLAIVSGTGADLRRPLGITIVGGLLLSQLFTLYTTPVIWLLLDRLRWRPRHRAVVAGRGSTVGDA